MFCPECGAEYRPGFYECSDCRVPLVAAKPREEKERPDPDLELVTVFEGNDPLLVAAAKSVLEEAGIPFHVLGEELAVRLGPVGALINPWRRIQVGVDREQEARGLIEELTPGAEE